jgi:hypothetical protein
MSACFCAWPPAGGAGPSRDADGPITVGGVGDDRVLAFPGSSDGAGRWAVATGLDLLVTGVAAEVGAGTAAGGDFSVLDDHGNLADQGTPAP